MKHWFGYRAVEHDGTNPGRKCLSEECSSYDEAKAKKQKIRSKNMEVTAVFRAATKDEAESLLEKEPFSRL